ncbi:MAG: DUF4912 domain-containing protein [Geminocystis sp.]|nr:DUF4912 domain-containing protein [Geminocystis sp.]HIK37625.1 DUF4912 domain-containing protein [Geminocystis sp. M7585_C2015_104]MCS7146571.1 DUF4912 domain-containing protein [Geminocystis sp.]MCX8077530.1 DUF4912 domain-containing protein [Geminocystis sp.]MDW8115397.1 DUF4912 domain-containing protein [Geminocystis sp.]
MTESKQNLEEMTLRQLRKIASILNIPRYSRMRKQQLLEAIRLKKNSLLQQQQGGEENQLEKTPSEGEETTKNTNTISIHDGGNQETSSRKRGQWEDFFLSPDKSVAEEEVVDLPSSYGETHICLMPRDSYWGFVYWDISPSTQQELTDKGIRHLVLRLYDVTGGEEKTPQNVKEFLCGISARKWYLPIPVSDRVYRVELGYRDKEENWTSLAYSPSVRFPPAYPSDWQEDIFVTVSWDMELDKVSIPLPEEKTKTKVDGWDYDWYLQIDTNNTTGSRQMWSKTAAEKSYQTRKFYLTANAQLVIYGATQPSARLIVGEREIPLNPDGTFQFQIPLNDGTLEFPIRAVAADGKKSRYLRLRFSRETHENEMNDWFTPPGGGGNMSC